MYNQSVAIGRLFRETYAKDNRTAGWSSKVEGATIAQEICNLMKNYRLEMGEAMDHVVQMAFAGGLPMKYHGVDPYSQGFAVGYMKGEM